MSSVPSAVPLFENVFGPQNYIDENHFAKKQGDKKRILSKLPIFGQRSGFHQEIPFFTKRASNIGEQQNCKVPASTKIESEKSCDQKNHRRGQTSPFVRKYIGL